MEIECVASDEYIRRGKYKEAILRHSSFIKEQVKEKGTIAITANNLRKAIDAPTDYKMYLLMGRFQTYLYPDIKIRQSRLKKTGEEVVLFVDTSNKKE